MHRCAASSAAGLRQRHHGGGAAGAAAPGGSPSTVFRAPEDEVVDYEADWHSGSELSDAYETDDGAEDAPGARRV